MDTRDLDKLMAQRRRVAALKAKVGLMEAPTKGWMTMEAIGKQLRVSPRAALQKMAPWIDAGMVQTKTFCIQRRMITRPIPHYKLNPEVAKAYGIR